MLRVVEWFWHRDSKARWNSVVFRDTFKWRSLAVPLLELNSVFVTSEAILAEAEGSYECQRLVIGSSHLS